MKAVCVLLNDQIRNDSRVIKIISTLSKTAKVDLYYINGKEDDYKLFNNNTRLFNIDQKQNWKLKIIRHSFFYNEFMFYVKYVLSQNIKYTHIWANDLPCLKPACVLKKKLDATLIYDSHEIYIESINQFFPHNSGLFKKIIFRLLIWIMKMLGKLAEKKYAPKAEFFITVNCSLKNYFKKQYHIENIDILYNYPVLENVEDRIDLHAKFNIAKENKIVIYQGGLQYGRGLELLIETFRYTKDNISLVIIGNGPLKNSIIKKTTEYNLSDRIIFHDSVDRSCLLTFTRGADIGINLLEPINLNTTFALPNKLFEYIHSGIPVIATDMVEVRGIIDKYNVGIIVSRNPKEIARVISNISDAGKDLYYNNCMAAAKEYNWAKEEQIILNVLNH